MGRKPRHDEDQLLDAAVELVREAGPAAVTMSAVARAAGAPSGSVYHRFPDRPALLAALWLRTVTSFQAAFIDALAAAPGRDGLVAAARSVVRWSRAHRGEAAVLIAGPESFGLSEWSEDDRRALRENNERLMEELLRAAHLMGAESERDIECVVMAVVDVPHATVRRHLHQGGDFSAHAEDAVAQAAKAILARVGTADPDIGSPAQRLG